MVKSIKSINICILLILFLCQSAYGNGSEASSSPMPQYSPYFPLVELGFFASRLNNYSKWTNHESALNNHYNQARVREESILKKYLKSSAKFLLQPETTSFISAYLYSLPSRKARICAVSLAHIPSLLVAAKISKKMAIYAWHPVQSYHDAKNRINAWKLTYDQMNDEERSRFNNRVVRHSFLFLNDYINAVQLSMNFWCGANNIVFCDSPDASRLQSLSSYNPEYAAMAQQLGIDPHTIHIDNSGQAGSPASCGGYHSHLLALDGMDQFSPQIQKAIVGHELIHIRDHATVKSFWAFGAGYVLICTGIKGLNWLTQKARENCDPNSTSFIAKVTRTTNRLAHGMYRAPYISLLVRAVLLRIVLKYYKRPFEKSADIDSARQFGTAQDLIDAFTIVKQKEEEYKQALLDALESGEKAERDAALAQLVRYYISKCFDEHPSLDERIRYLQPIAQEQATALAKSAQQAPLFSIRI